MADGDKDNALNSVEFEFLKAHIAATMTLTEGLIAQGAVDARALDEFFSSFLARLPGNRQTLALRMIIEQWRQALAEDGGFGAAYLSVLADKNPGPGSGEAN
ncbi:hypothetical protein H2509_05370 [Stappia sp. F7233]|uniref:Uncharacterized protein n=1 Tax=Stappia albiluteola TaxID=2758565 RepID=A0A839AAX2_9HYPH|nr:hypothetical protein [Stappia albiluteola]MBA5776551.1 hypothetical protein [Stappia albiluteola]